MKENEREKEAWASFVYELRRSGYRGSPEVWKEYFRGFYSDYLEGEKDDHLWEDSHCCDSIDGEDFNFKKCWMFWSEEDKKKAEQEYEELVK